MSLKTVYLAARVESSDSFHLARLLILLDACAGRRNRPVEGIMKLAKLDFLLRYPNCLVRALEAVGREDDARTIDEDERNTVEARMVRFRFGPWDSRYRRWIGLLVSRRLAHTYRDGQTVKVQLTDDGRKLAEVLKSEGEFVELARRSKLVSVAVGRYSATKLRNFVYEVFPEIVDMKWGEGIRI